MARVIEIEFSEDEIEVYYDDDSSEVIEDGIYERTDFDGETVELRRATLADYDRLYALADDFAGVPDEDDDDDGYDGDSDVALSDLDASYIVSIEREGSEIEIEYSTGHEESLDGGYYELDGPGIEIERRATEDDFARFDELIREFEGLGGTVEDEDYNDQYGSDDDDDIDGSGGKDRIVLGDGDDHCLGRYDDDVIRAGRGRDDVNGGRGNDDVAGGNGHDEVRGGTGHDKINAGRGDDDCDGGRGNDVVYGLGGEDTLRGGGGDDNVHGGGGDDRCRGDGGDDIVDGGAGRDHYWGGAGADLFVFHRDGSFDKIHDFEDGFDRIDLSDFGMTIDGVLAAAVQDGDDVVIDLGDGDILKIDDIETADLDASDFIL